MMRSAAAICALAWLAAAAEYPQPTGFVNDFAHQLSPTFASNLEDQLRGFQQTTAHEIAVVTVPSLGGESIETYASGLFHAWRIGRPDVNDGVLFVWAPTERRVRIATGSGLARMLPDPLAKQIVEDITARFRNQDFEGGITLGVNEIEQALQGAPAPRAGSSGSGFAGSIFLVAAGAVVLLIATVVTIMRRGRAIELRHKLPATIDRDRRRIHEDANARVAAARAALNALRQEAPQEIWTGHESALADAPAAYAHYQREIEEVALQPRNRYGQLNSVSHALDRLESHLAQTNWRLDGIKTTLDSFRAQRDQARSLFPGLARAVVYTPQSKFTEAARETLVRAEAEAAKNPANWFLIRDLLSDTQICLDHANGHRPAARPAERLWPVAGAPSPAMEMLMAANAFAASQSPASYDGSSWDSSSSSPSSSGSDFGGFSGGDTSGGGASGSY